ncbi:serine/threonine-protein phosphatase [Streptomyces sp. A0642]|uniref:PP2C family protein-serine/threonine phosphatase n=1 Tax=Streptomyces sp. A0642 TaxID=2563100 RepID=UPI0010A24D0C|nr:PP2C family protein-serine/threonine phosphatase [Streptomyces sp. A0642]THA77481.1 serine/threonine-protein phosphatase [Streptomyces sp. A0642]
MSPHRRVTGLLLPHVTESETFPSLPSWVRWTPPVLTGVALAADLPTPGEWSGDVLLALSAMTAACVYPPALVVLMAVLNSAAGLLLLLATHLGADGGHAVIDYCALLVLAWASIPLCWLRLSLYRRLHGAQQAAEYAQRAVLPPVRSWLDHTWIAVRYEAASRAAAVGGDLYAAEATPYGVRLLIGDVRGKGPDAIPAVAALVGSFREAAHHTETLPLLARHLDEAVARYIRDLASVRGGAGSPDEQFITAAVAEIPAGGGEVRLLSRGHCPAYLATGEGVRPWEPADAGLPLGLGDLDPGPWEYETRSFVPGDLLLLCTDGLLESRDAHGAFFSPEDGLRASWRQGPPTVVETLAALVHRHAGGSLADDLALIAATVHPTGPLPPTSTVVGGGAV